MRGACVWTALVATFLLGGCPATTQPGSRSDPNAPQPNWLDGDWLANATSPDQSVTGCLTITSGKVTVLGHGCEGEKMPILAAPAATYTDTAASVSVTVIGPDNLTMVVNMHLTEADANRLTGTITTLSLGRAPFIGSVTLQRR